MNAAELTCRALTSIAESNDKLPKAAVFIRSAYAFYEFIRSLSKTAIPAAHKPVLYTNDSAILEEMKSSEELKSEFYRKLRDKLLEKLKAEQLL